MSKKNGKSNGKATENGKYKNGDFSKPGTANIIGKGFDARPEAINRTGLNKGSKKLSVILREMLDETVEVDINGKKEKRTLKDILVRKLITKASRGDGDVRAISEIFDRVDGKPQDNEGQPNEMIIRVQRSD